MKELTISNYVYCFDLQLACQTELTPISARLSNISKSSVVFIFVFCGPSSVVGIATAYWSRDRIPVEARFSAHVQTGPEAHPASSTMGTASFPVVRCGRGVTLTPHPLLVSRSKNRVELYL